MANYVVHFDQSHTRAMAGKYYRHKRIPENSCAIFFMTCTADLWLVLQLQDIQ